MASPSGSTYLHYTDDQPEIRIPEDSHPANLVKGVGVIASDGQRYRVVDVWVVLQEGGRLAPGRHIIIEPESALGPLVHAGSADH